MNKKDVTGYLEGVMIQQYKTDVGFRTLVESVNDNMYIIPKYQRKYRWNKEQVVRLVESLLKGLPIPPIYTCRNEKMQLEILDGQQRVMSLFFYYIGYFLNARKNSAVDFSSLDIGNETFKEALMNQFVLDELHIDLEDENGGKINVDYSKLPLEIRRRLDYTSITVIEIKIERQDKREEILRTIFANLNRGGVTLSDQEQRNGIYNCKFYDMLQIFNRENKKWREIWGRESSKEKDMECLLRFCALKKYASVKKDDFVISSYKSSYANMLDCFSKEAMKFDNNEIDEYRKSLEGFVELFDVTSTFSSKVALLESFYIVYEKKQLNITITKELCDQILGSKPYKENSRQGTVKLKNMNERWKAVYEISSRFN